ncbi:uracil-DNA glycosylase [Arthrobacter sp. NPDC097144]|uniref:uracil-DNA glycosylase n=1 Tax=Arthrobacter sp. NPDC097144 TaxID=3363946 RepID=UPI00381E6451
MNANEPTLFPLPPEYLPQGSLSSEPGSAAAGVPFPFAAPAALSDVMAPDWAAALAPARSELHRIAGWLEEERGAGNAVLPEPGNILRAFSRPLAEVKVLLIGQDPYPTPGHAVGLSFSVDRGVRPLPRSLNNIYKELDADLGITPCAHGDLSAWSDQGVLLLNRVLTVRAGNAGSHRKRGWEQITELAVRAVVGRRSADGGREPLVAVLWGNDARSIVPLLGEVPRIESAHPSPLSASRGFFGSRPFSRVNELLQSQGAEPVDWALDGIR